MQQDFDDFDQDKQRDPEEVYQSEEEAESSDASGIYALKNTSRTQKLQSLLPFVGMDQRMKLDQVQLVRTKPV